MEKKLPEALKALEEARLAVLEKHLENGVRFLGIDGVIIDGTVTIGPDTVIEPGVVLRGGTVIGKSCTITSGSRIEDCIIGDGTTINASQCYRSRIGKEVSIGPFSHIRPDSDIAAHVRRGHGGGPPDLRGRQRRGPERELRLRLRHGKLRRGA